MYITKNNSIDHWNHNITQHTTFKPADDSGVRSQFYLTDDDLVVELVRILAQSICHVRDPVSQVVHSIFTTNAGGETEKPIGTDNMTNVGQWVQVL